MSMPAKSREERAARLQRPQQMKRGNRAAGAVRFFSVLRYHYRRAAIALDHSRRGNTNHAAMPALAVNHHAKRVTQGCVISKLLLNGFHDAAFFFLALSVEFVETLCDFASLRPVLGAEKIDHIAGDVHAPSGVDSRSVAKGNFAGA